MKIRFKIIILKSKNIKLACLNKNDKNKNNYTAFSL